MLEGRARRLGVEGGDAEPASVREPQPERPANDAAPTDPQTPRADPPQAPRPDGQAGGPPPPRDA